MNRRNLYGLAICTVALGCFSSLSSAHRQGSAPFTIRRPPDGAYVREKVRIEIPRASVSSTGFVSFYLDNTFQIALAPAQNQSINSRFFTYIWDTKGTGIKDGPHSIRAVLYEPAAGSTGSAINVNEMASSEVKVNVANIIHNGPTTLRLRYKYREGQNLVYQRDGKNILVGGISAEAQKTSDTDFASVNSTLQLGIEDSRPGISLVRNKLTSLKLLTGGQESTYDANQLSNSMYQELDPIGHVLYETGTGSGFEEFAAQGLPVNNTLELPLLPTSDVSIGDTWRTENQRMDVPGMPPALQPRVSLENKLVDLEWEGGYPTARIHQHGQASVKAVLFGPIDVNAPTLTFDRDIYIAYKSGTLVKTSRTLTVAGRTTTDLTAFTGAPAGGGAPGGLGGNGFPGAGRGFGGGGEDGVGAGKGRRGGFGGGAPGSFGGSGGPPAGFGGAPGGGRRGGFGGGFPGGGGAPGSFGGGAGRQGRGGFGGGAPGSFGGSGGPPAGFGGAPGGGRRGGFGGGFPGGGNGGGGGERDADRAVTLKSTSVTALISNTGAGADVAPTVRRRVTRTAKTTRTTKITRRVTRRH